MSKLATIILGMLILGLAFLWYRADAIPSADRGPMVVVGVAAEQEHRVTPSMEAASKAMADREAPPFRLRGGDGRTYDSADLIGREPLVLVFIQDGCPCSASAEPFFDRLHRAYGEASTFLGVIDGGPDVASAWVSEHGTPFPVLADADMEVIRAYDIRNSAYVALIDRDGSIVAIWPGYSSEILVEISERLAAMTGLNVADVGDDEAPLLPYSGCPFPVSITEGGGPVPAPVPEENGHEALRRGTGDPGGAPSGDARPRPSAVR